MACHKVMTSHMDGEAVHCGHANGLLDRRSFHKVSMKKRKNQVQKGASCCLYYHQAVVREREGVGLSSSSDGS